MSRILFRSTVISFLILFGLNAWAQTGVQIKAQAKLTKPALAADVSGMYSFLQEGEFVQLTLEPDADPSQKPVPVTGFISRYGDLESDKGAFLDHFFSKGTLHAGKLSFTTKTVHGVWFEFNGKLERGAAKSRSEEGYYVIKGTLHRNATDANKKTSTQSREVSLKSFPDVDAEDPAKPKQ